ncbi:MAG: hypothetical protein COV48_06900, partial [Elusimicrobia bacterium CG11_big_fil_rev_8_21_14_0_20_64_6]
MTLKQEPDPLRRIPTKHTADLRAEIGPILRAARLKRGQSLEAVAQQTRISKRFLEALEENRFEQFPAIVYLRGFLKGYCEHLDVSFEEMWSLLTAAQDSPVEAAPAPDSPASAAPHAPSASEAAATPTEDSAHSAHGTAPEHQGSGATGAIVFAVALAIGLAVFLFKDQNPEQAPSAPQPPAVLQPVARALEPKLVVRLVNDAWLRVSVDDRVVFEGRAPRGAVQEWSPARFVDL